ncbi:hypothetical protein [Streptomyces sp. NPDC052114]|uniref:hypothetical protein n=1 Tax=unclassified Streptomyces TaxID=2593676 RepID=UPI00341BBCAB
MTLWHVFLTVAGPPLPTADVRRTLERFAAAHPFALTARYAADHAEVRYWEEAHDLRDAAATALRLWQGHGASTELTGWIVTGLEIIDRATYHQRTASGAALHRPEAGGYGKEPAVSGTGQDMLRERRGRRPGS